MTSQMQNSVIAVDIKKGSAITPPKKSSSPAKSKKIHAPAFVRQQVGYLALFTSWFAGLLYAPTLDMMAIALSMIIVAVFFLMQEPVALLEDAFRTGHEYRKRWQPYVWLGVLGVGGLAAGIPLVAMRPTMLWLAIPAVALLGIYLVLRRYGVNQLILSMIGFSALAVASPIGRIAADPFCTWQELTALWILPSAFFCLSIMTLHIRMTGESGVKPALYISGMLVTVIGFLIGLEIMPTIAMAVILVQVVKLGFIAADVKKFLKWPIRSVNTMEMVFSILFVIINAIH